MSVGADIVALAQRHLKEPYLLGSHIDYTTDDFHGPWDCAEFASWCVYRVSAIRFGLRVAGPIWEAYSGHWAQDAIRAQADIRWQDAASIAGSILVRRPGPDGKGGHVAISTGTNATVEAMGRAFGVTTGRIQGRVWDIGVLVPGIQYTRAPLSAFPKMTLFTLRASALPPHGPLIESIVHRLTQLKHYEGPPTDQYDVNVAEAVGRFQEVQGIVKDHELGARAYARLMGAGKATAARRGARRSARRAK